MGKLCLLSREPTKGKMDLRKIASGLLPRAYATGERYMGAMINVFDLARQIYLAKMQGFWANPDSQCELAEPCFSKCVEDAREVIAYWQRLEREGKGPGDVFGHGLVAV